MIDIQFKLQWIESLKEWRVIGSGGHYAGSNKFSGILGAIDTMLKSEADAIMRSTERDRDA